MSLNITDLSLESCLPGANESMWSPYIFKVALLALMVQYYD